MIRFGRLMRPAWSHLTRDLTWPFLENPFQQRLWTEKIRLPGFQPENIQTKIEKSEDGDKHNLKIHARQSEGNDFSEVKKTVVLPPDVDIQQLEINFSRRGDLIIEAPFKDSAFGEISLLDEFDKFRNIDNLNGKTEIVSDSDGKGENFKVEYNMAGFKPEEIKVEQKGNKIIIKARQEDNTNSSSSYRQLRRELALPDGVNLEKIVSKLLENGTLQLIAPYNRPKEPEGRQIPIETQNK